MTKKKVKLAGLPEQTPTDVDGEKPDRKALEAFEAERAAGAERAAELLEQYDPDEYESLEAFAAAIGGDQ